MLGWTGIGRYTRRLVEELADVDPALDLLLVTGPAGVAGWRPPTSVRVAATTTARPHRPREQLVLPSLLRRLQPDLVHFPHLSVPVAYRHPFVLTVHDLTLLRYPARPGRSPLTSARRVVKQQAGRATLRQALAHAAIVLTPSHHTAQDVVATFGVDPAKVVAVPNGIDPPAPATDPVPGLDPHRPFAVYVGNCHPHKNVGLAIEAVARLARDGTDLRLVIAGPDGAWTDHLRHQTAQRRLADRVVFTGPVSDTQLTWLYRHAALLVQPSLAEGFGFTGLEAMAHGLPVVAARSSCLPEIYGDAASWFAPHDPAGAAAAMAAVLGGPERRRRLVAAGLTQARRYSWRATAEAVLARYREAVGAGMRRGAAA